MKRFIIFGCALLFGIRIHAQKLPDGGVHKLHVDRPGMTLDAELIPVKAPARPDPKLWYFWAGGGDVHSTQGGVSGHLLNGAYHAFFEDGSPSESGNFSAGLKTGIWRTWNSDGTLKQTLTYKNGQRSGDFSVFDAGGKLRQSGAYRDDLLEGAVRDQIGPDSAVVTWYHQGKVVKHRPLIKRLNPFNRKQRDTVVHTH